MMSGGTIFLSRAKMLHKRIKNRLEEIGFVDVVVSDREKDGLNFLIDEVKPRLLMIGAAFYQAGTPYMTGELHREFPKLNIAAVSVFDYPLSLAPWFIWHGAKSYVNLWEGYEEFHEGLQIVRKGRQYISPKTMAIMEQFPDWPDTRSKLTNRLQACLVLLCCGFEIKSIGEELHISEKTVYNHIGFLYETFHVKNREEMIALAWQLDIVNKSDIRFYDKNHNNSILTLPDWAAIKQKINRSLYDCED